MKVKPTAADLPSSTVCGEPDEACADAAVNQLLEKVVATPASEGTSIPGPVGLRSARLVAVSPTGIQIALRGRDGALDADLAEGVDRELLVRASVSGDAVLVEQEAGHRFVIVGILQTRVPTKLELRAETIHIEAEREVLLRTGSAAIRLREDGDVEIVGGRVLTMSRGLFRLVGRVLRLN